MRRHVKTILPAILSVVLFAAVIFGIVLPKAEESMMANKKELIRTLTESAWHVLALYEKKERAGLLSRQEAQNGAREQIEAMRYGPEGKDYFWINDMRPYMVMHPYRTDLNGKDLSQYEDARGNRLFVEFVKTVRRQGAGYVAYSWQWKDDPKRIVPKISYVKGFKPWGWIIGTGIYIEDVRAEMASMNRRIILAALFIFLVTLFLSGYLIFKGIRAETSREEAHEALRSTLEKYSAALEVSPNPIVVYDEKGRAQYLNRAFTRVFGWALEDVAGKQIDFVPKENRQETTEAIQAIYTRPEGFFTFESRRYTKSGRILDVNISAAIFHDRQGKPVGMVVHLRDITERIRTEQALKESEEKFRSISANALDGIVMMDPEGNISFWNEAAERLFQFSREEVLGRDLHRMLASDAYLVEYEKASSEFRRTGQGSAVGKILELTAAKKDGTEFPIELSVSSLKLQDQWYAVGIIRDITYRKQAEQSMLMQKEQLLSIFDSMNLVVTVIDLKTHEILFMNKYTRQLLGSDPVGQTCYRVFRNRETPCRECTDGGSADNREEASQYEYHNDILGKDLLVTSRSIRWPDGRDVKLEFAFDLTDRKKAERERALLENQLRQAQKMEAIGTLAGGIAHDFNNILGAVIGYTELAMTYFEKDDIPRKYMDRVLSAGNRAKNLVQQILSFSRQDEKEKKPVELAPLVKESMKLLRATLPATIEIHQRFEDAAGVVLADPTQIHQVLMNLCANASHAMKEKGGILEIGMERVEIRKGAVNPGAELSAGEYLSLSVSDTGPGIAEELKERIFEPFFTTKGKGEGTGMGLSVVHGIVKSHGGAIRVHSSPGQGAEFQVLLPLIKSAPDDPILSSQQDTPVPEGTERILFVDDEAPLVDVATRMLGKYGYRLKGCTSSREAMSLFKAAPEDFDLIITDQTMPHMTGLELAKACMTIRPDIPVILCTGFSESVSEEQARRDGIRAFVMKPLVTFQLASTIRSVMEGKSVS
jgi:PAS domain S-box-containing protein